MTLSDNVECYLHKSTIHYFGALQWTLLFILYINCCNWMAKLVIIVPFVCRWHSILKLWHNLYLKIVETIKGVCFSLERQALLQLQLLGFLWPVNSNFPAHNLELTKISFHHIWRTRRQEHEMPNSASFLQKPNFHLSILLLFSAHWNFHI